MDFNLSPEHLLIRKMMAEFTENGVLANLTELGYSLDDDVIPATTAIWA